MKKVHSNDVVVDGICYRPTENGYGVYTHTEDVAFVVIPDQINDKPVVALLKNCFSKSAIQQIALPDSIFIIEERAFAECKNLEAIKIPDNVEKIGARAFKFCRNLKRVELGKNTKVLGEGSFESCTRLEEFVVYDALEFIDINCFCQSLKHLKHTEYSNGLYFGNVENPHMILYDSIGEYSHPTFVDISALTGQLAPHGQSCDIHPETRFIIGTAFYNTGASEIHVHDKICQIESGAFSGCGAHAVYLDSMDILFRPNSTGSPLSHSAKMFVAEQEIKEIVVPDNIHKIPSHCFAYCDWLHSAIFEGDVEIDSNAFAFCKKLSQVNFCKSVKKIGPDAFRYCRALKQITFPQKVEIIYGGAFEESGLIEVCFNDTVESMGQDAFKGCKNLTQVKGLNNVKKIMPTWRNCYDPFEDTPLAGKHVQQFLK